MISCFSRVSASRSLRACREAASKIGCFSKAARAQAFSQPISQWLVVSEIAGQLRWLSVPKYAASFVSNIFFFLMFLCYFFFFSSFL